MARTFGFVVIVSVIMVDFVITLSVDNQLANARNGKNFFDFRLRL